MRGLGNDTVMAYTSISSTFQSVKEPARIVSGFAFLILAGMSYTNPNLEHDFSGLSKLIDRSCLPKRGPYLRP